MTTGMFEFYAARSGLAAGTLGDHMLAYFKSLSGLSEGTLSDHMNAYFGAASGVASGTLSDKKRAFYQQQLGSSSPNLDDLMAAYFGDPFTLAPPQDTPLITFAAYDVWSDTSTIGGSAGRYREKRVGSPEVGAGVYQPSAGDLDIAGSSYYRYHGFPSAQDFASNSTRSVSTPLKPGGSSQFANWLFGVEFVTSAPQVRIALNPVTTNGALGRILVNGRRISDRTPAFTASGGNPTEAILTFPDARPRTIKISGLNQNQGRFGGVTVSAGYTVAKPTAPVKRRIAFIGDSFVNGNGIGATSASETETFIWRLAKLMGADEVIQAGVGGTGFVAGGGDGVPAGVYQSRIADVLAQKPDAIVFSGGYNDSTTGLSSAIAAALAATTSVSERYVVFTGPDPSVGAVYQSAANAGNVMYALGDITGLPLMDGIHPTYAGHQTLADRIFAQLQVPSAPGTFIAAGVAPVINPIPRAFSYNNNAGSNTMTLTPASNVQLGDIIFAVVTSSTGTTTVTPVETSWNTLITNQQAGTLFTWIYWRRRAAGETTYRFTFDANGGSLGVGGLFAFGRADVPSIFSALANRTVDKTNTAPSITTALANALAVLISTERTTTTEAAVTTVPTGWTELGFVPQGSTQIQTIWVGTKAMPTVGATGAASVVYPNTQAVNGQAMQAAIPPKSLANRVTDIAHWMAKPFSTAAHRGFAKTWPEMTKFAYDEAVSYGADAIEISVFWSSDGTAWAIHDNDLTVHTSGTGNIASVNDAYLAGVTVNAASTTNTAQSPQPLSKLTDILAAYGDNVVVLIEDKSTTHYAQLLAILQTYPHYKERFIWKQAGQQTPYAAAVAAGMKTWGYLFYTEEAQFAANQAKWSYIGVDFQSTDTVLASQIALAGADRVIAHILASGTRMAQMQALGIKHFMVTDAALIANA